MKTIHITQGLDLRLAGAPDQNGVPENKDVWHVSITGGDYVGMKPTICVEEGDRVFAGQLLFFDKKNPGVKFVAPGAGVVQELHRGERRVFQSLDIKLDSGDDFLLSVPYEKTPADKLLSLSDKETRARLVDSGLWIALRTRPFSRIPKVDATPVALFVNAADTNPHAPNPQKIIDARSDDFVNGLRVTDKETADIVQMVLAGKINKSLVNLLEIKGGKAMGISGMDGHMIEAVPKSEKLGYVGSITKVNVEPITDLLDRDYIPVVSTVGCDGEGNVYNINADTAAAYIAGAMKAERLITMTDIEGILRDKNDPDSLITCIDTEQAKSLFADGTITGGMIPKVECCIEAIQRGVEKVIILDGRVPHALLIETLTDEGAGTMVTGDKSNER